MESMPDRFVERRLKWKANVASALAFLLILGIALVVLMGCGIPKKRYSDDIALALLLGRSQGYTEAVKTYGHIRGCPEARELEVPYKAEIEQLLDKAK